MLDILKLMISFIESVQLIVPYCGRQFLSVGLSQFLLFPVEEVESGGSPSHQNQQNHNYPEGSTGSTWALAPGVSLWHCHIILLEAVKYVQGSKQKVSLKSWGACIWWKFRVIGNYQATLVTFWRALNVVSNWKSRANLFAGYLSR